MPAASSHVWMGKIRVTPLWGFGRFPVWRPPTTTNTHSSRQPATHTLPYRLNPNVQRYSAAFGTAGTFQLTAALLVLITHLFIFFKSTILVVQFDCSHYFSPLWVLRSLLCFITSLVTVSGRKIACLLRLDPVVTVKLPVLVQHEAVYSEKDDSFTNLWVFWFQSSTKAASHF